MMSIKYFVAITSLVGALSLASAMTAQRTYPTPEDAANALVEGVRKNDEATLAAAVGPDWRKYIPSGTVDPEDVRGFLSAWDEKHSIVPDGSDKAYVSAGQYGWRLPIPLVKADGGWRFDTAAAPREMRIRRIGRNELDAIQVALAYTDAQREYFTRDWDNDGHHEYAMRGVSSPGKHDGLYWPSLPDEPESPAGPEFADATPGQPFHGYQYRILTRQGPNAPGGPRDYVKNGEMTGGYALIAWPAKYGDTGVMTFIVNQDGVVYQKNLGPNTPAEVRRIDAFNPDQSWQRVSWTQG